MRVGVKFCGHCNPDVEGPALIKAVNLINAGLEFIPWESGDYELLLVFSACQVDCVTVPEFNGPIVHVVGNILNGKRWSLEQLPGAIAITIKIMAAIDQKMKLQPQDGPRFTAAGTLSSE